MRLSEERTGATSLPVLKTNSDDRFEDVRERVEALIAEHGGVLLRGLGIDSAERFQSVVEELGDPLWQSYRGGNTPRSAITAAVFTSTEYPARFDISLHNEMSYANRWPAKLFFCCLIAAETGGATPVCDGKALVEDLKPDVRERFIGHGVVYHQHMHGGFGLGKSWQQTFETDDPAEVEKFLQDSDATFSWTEDGGLRVAQHRPAVRAHPVTGEQVWFNQADQWHPSTLPGDEAETLLEVVESPEDLPHWVTYGDGSLISEDDLNEVRLAADRNKVAVPWQAGDLLMVDNMRMLHGRQAYTGARRIAVAMT